MANTSSAKKAVRVSQRKKIVNDKMRETFRVQRTAFEKAVAAGETKKKLEEKLSTLYKSIDKSAKKSVNILSENKAARMKSRYAGMVTK